MARKPKVKEPFFKQFHPLINRWTNKPHKHLREKARRKGRGW